MRGERPTKIQKLDVRVEVDQGNEDVILNADILGLQPSVLPAPTEWQDGHSICVEGQTGEPNGGNNLAEPGLSSLGGEPDLQQSSPPLSKNQLKKLKKREEWEAGREYRKAKRKEKIAQKKARKRESSKLAASRPGENGDDGLSHDHKRFRPRNPTLLPITFVIDCGFDQLMLENERISLGSQLTRAYSDNRHAPFQAHLVVSSWGGSLKERFDTVLARHHENWRGITFVPGDFIEAARYAEGVMKGKGGGNLSGVFKARFKPDKQRDVPDDDSNLLSSDLEDNPEIESPKRSLEIADGKENPKTQPSSSSDDSVPQPRSSTTHRDDMESHPLQEGEVIYLTSDSPNTLDELKPYSTYIVGGLVDKNRHKGICYKIACDKGIKTAKLPIGDYIRMRSRFVLATNHVIEIMLRWLECGDWGQAFMQAIPKRKGGELKDGDEEGSPGQVPIPSASVIGGEGKGDPGNGGSAAES